MLLSPISPRPFVRHIPTDLLSDGGTTVAVGSAPPLDGPDPLRELVALLSAAGHPVPVAVLAVLVGDTEVVVAAEESGLVDVGVDGVVALADGVAPMSLARLRRARLRGRLGAALRGSCLIDEATVAGHLLAGAMATADAAALRAALDIVASLAWSERANEAMELAKEALTVLDAGLFEVALRVRALVSLADAAGWSGRAEVASMARAQAVELACRQGDVQFVATTLVAAVGSLAVVDDDPSLLAEMDRCISTLGGATDRRSQRLYAVLLAVRAERTLAYDPMSAQQWSANAVELARVLGEPEPLARCLAAHRVTSWHPRRQAVAIDLATEMVAIGPHTRGHRELGAIARLQTCLELGDFVGFDVDLARLQVRTSRFGTPVERRWCNVLAGARCLIRGEWDEVRGHIAAARASGAGPDLAVTEELLLAQEVLIAWHLGADLSAHLGAAQRGATPSAVDADPAGWGPLRSSWRACLLGLAAPTLDRDSLERALSTLLADGVDGLRDDLTWGPVVACASMAAVVARSTSHARMLAQAIEPIADQWAGTAGAVSFGPFRWHLGRLLASVGERAAAETHLLEVLDRCDAAAARPWSARAHLALATIDPVRHRDHAGAASELAAGLGMRRVHQLASQVLGELVEPARPRGLTRREVEVLGHVAEGCTNRDIAARMFLSVKTVERHLLNAYTKAGLRNRSEATAFVLRHGLAD